MLSQHLPQWGVACPQVPEIGSVFHQSSCFGGFFCCFGLLGACFFDLCPFSGAMSVIHQPPPCCQCVVMVCWLLFIFVLSFDFGHCSLAWKISFVDHFLPYFRKLLFFFWAGGQSVQGTMLICPRGNCGNTTDNCQMSTNQVWSWWLVAQEPSSFLSVLWHGEAL
jgi:hypothetical protein